MHKSDTVLDSRGQDLNMNMVGYKEFFFISLKSSRRTLELSEKKIQENRINFKEAEQRDTGRCLTFVIDGR